MTNIFLEIYLYNIIYICEYAINYVSAIINNFTFDFSIRVNTQVLFIREKRSKSIQ